MNSNRWLPVLWIFCLSTVSWWACTPPSTSTKEPAQDASISTPDNTTTDTSTEPTAEPDSLDAGSSEPDAAAEPVPEVRPEPTPEPQPDYPSLPDTDSSTGKLGKYFGSLRYKTKATGYFRTEQIHGKWWLITPDGHPFFSAGMNGVRAAGTATKDGKKHYEKTILAKYTTRKAWADGQYTRLLKWGWNTIGSWSDWTYYTQRMPYTVILNLAGNNIENKKPLDFFADSFLKKIRTNLNKVVPFNLKNPWLIGYFLDNEMHWGPDHRGGHLFDEYFAFAADTPGKKRLVQFLRDRYKDLKSLAVDFEFTVSNWDALLALKGLKSRSTKGAKSTRAAWSGVVAEQYFRLTHTELRKLDPHHLNLGVRFISQLTPRAVIEQAGKYVDVMTVNFYDLAAGLAELLESMDPDYLTVRNNLAEHYKAGKKPILVSEWGFRAKDSGLPNTFPPIYPTLKTQKDRADAYEAKFRALLRRPWIVGQHWFIYADQPPEGRFDGENNNFGLVNEKDEPYLPLVNRSAMMGRLLYGLLPSKTNP